MKNVNFENEVVEFVIDGWGMSDELIVGKLNDKLVCVDMNGGMIMEIDDVDEIFDEYEVNGYEILKKKIEDMIDVDEFEIL